MRTLRPLLTAGLLLAATAPPAVAQLVDPTFTPSNLYSVGTIYSTTEQPDGKRLVAGYFTRVNGVAAATVARFETGGGLDAAFQQNLGAATGAYRPRVLANGQILLTGLGGPLVAGGLTRPSVLRLNANGTGDASFDAGTGASLRGNPIFTDDVLPLASGQVVVVGPFDHFNGVAANRIVRLTATGAVDPAFVSGAGASQEIDVVVGLPNGQLLIGGLFRSYDGHAANGLARLNADGSFDGSFVSPFAAPTEATNLVVQPDGKILVAGALFPAGGASGKGLLRVLPNGALDAGFSPPAALLDYSAYSYFGDAIQLQPDGKILCFTNNSGSNAPSGVARLNADGSPDASFQPAPLHGTPYSLTLLASGQVLVGGAFVTPNNLDNLCLVQLTATGADTSFQPLIESPGTVRALVRQADGKLIAGGSFHVVNGQAASGLARFNANGGLDATFLPGLYGGTTSVDDLALQPDGRLLVVARGKIQRLLATGAPDNTFAVTGPTNQIRHLALQPDGRVLVGGYGNPFQPPLDRLLANGATDASFAVAGAGVSGLTQVQALALQPDGKVVVTGGYNPPGGGAPIATVVRLQPSGAVDAAFTGREFQDATDVSGLNSVAVQPDGKVVVGGRFSGYGGTPQALVARLNADGTLDTGFAPPPLTGAVSTVVLQPNNRLLVGGTFAGPGVPANLARLLATGAADASYGGTAVPNAPVYALLVQPDGALVAGGSFTAVDGQASPALARIVAANVLQVAAPRAVAERTEAWPVPAQGALHVAFAPLAHAQAIELLDVLGRPVQRRPVAGHPTATLPLEGVAAGTYLLRVTYAEGAVTRRVQVQ